MAFALLSLGGAIRSADMRTLKRGTRSRRAVPAPPEPRRRYRSNVFHPKVKKPLSFELTEHGRELVDELMTRCEVSLGDLVEFFVREYGDEANVDAIERAASA
jgi:hypothetical protein